MTPTLSGATRIIFIVGDPVAQVKSPDGLTRWFRGRGHDRVVVPAHVAPADFAAFLQTAGQMANVDGVIVTIPHKFAAHAAASAHDPAAARTGTVNLLRRRPGGGWFGAMTDGDGCVLGLRKRGWDPQGQRVLLIGAGGAGTAVADALVAAGIASLQVCELDPARADRLVRTLAATHGFTATTGPANGTGFDLVVNATFVGTAATDPLPLDLATIAPTATVADLACGPNGCTALVAAERARGAITMTGDEMFAAMCHILGDFFLGAPRPEVTTSTAPDDPAAARLRQLLNGYQATQTIHVAAMLGVADHLSDAPTPVATLAEQVGAAPDALYRLLRALAALEVFTEHAGRRFSLAPMGAWLRSDATPSMRPWAMFISEPSRWAVWGALLHSVRTGENAFRHVHGMDSWTYRRTHPEAGALFQAAMTANSARIDQAVVAACELGDRRHLMDVGGGQGSLLAACLRANPHLEGTLFDQASVVDGADRVFEAASVASRVRVAGGDFFREVPAGADALLLKFILHDWEDAEALAILRAIRSAVAAGARLHVVEYLVAPPNTGLHAKMSDLSMLVGPGGRERTEAEYVALCEAAGFRHVRTVPAAGPLSVVVAEAR